MVMAEGYARRVLSTATDDSRYRVCRHSPAVAEFDQPLASGGGDLESRAAGLQWLPFTRAFAGPTRIWQTELLASLSSLITMKSHRQAILRSR